MSITIGTPTVTQIGGPSGTPTAPCLTHFDSTQTTASTTSRPFHHLIYIWDFGDPGQGTWATGSTNTDKNVAFGACAAHLYETAGTYDWSLTVVDPSDGTYASTSGSVTVADPDTTYSGTNTVVVSTSGNFTDKPSGATEVTSSNAASAIAANDAANRRILFRAGETWTCGNISVDFAGMQIGKFASGADPKFNGSSGTMLTTTANNITIYNLELDGTSGASIGVERNGGTRSNVLHVRINAHNVTQQPFVYYISETTAFSDGSYPYSMICFVECTAANSGALQAFFLAAQKLVMLGCTATPNNAAAHSLRSHYGKKGVISHCTLNPSGGGQDVIKLDAPKFVDSGNRYNELIVLSDNYLDGTGGSFTVGMGPQNPDSDERLRDVLFERNHVANSTYQSFMLWASACTVRNNLIDQTGADQDNTRFIEILRRGIEGTSSPAEDWPADNEIYNNTFYKGSSALAGGLFAINIGGDAVDTIVRNNIAYCSAGTGGTMVNDGGTGTISSNNTSNVRTSPSFVSGTPSAFADFQIQTGSYAKDAGFNALGMLLDAFGRSRYNVTKDMGFYEFTAGDTPWEAGGGGSPAPGPDSMNRPPAMKKMIGLTTRRRW